MPIAVVVGAFRKSDVGVVVVAVAVVVVVVVLVVVVIVVDRNIVLLLSV